LEKTSRPLKFTTDSNNSMGKSVSYGDTLPQCGLFTYTSVPVIFEPPCIYHTELYFNVNPHHDSYI